MSDRIRKSDEPDEPLAFLAASMTELVPEGTEAIVMLHDTETDRGASPRGRRCRRSSCI
jgi:hypothetical protein